MAGAIAIFERMNLGLVIGDYLGKNLSLSLSLVRVHTHTFTYIYSSLFLTTSYFSSNWSYFCCNRFCLYIAGLFCGLFLFAVEILIEKLLSGLMQYACNVTGAMSG